MRRHATSGDPTGYRRLSDTSQTAGRNLAAQALDDILYRVSIGHPIDNIGISEWTQAASALTKPPMAKSNDVAEKDALAVQTGMLIAQRRKALKLSQEQLAAELGIAQGTLGDWERGRSRPPWHRWARLTAALRCEITDIMPDQASTPAGRAILSMSEQDKAELINDRSVEHLFLYAYDQLADLRRQYPTYFELYRIGFGIGFIRGDRELALMAFRIVHGFAISQPPEQVGTAVRKHVAELRTGIGTVGGVIEKFATEAE